MNSRHWVVLTVFAVSSPLLGCGDTSTGTPARAVAAEAIDGFWPQFRGPQGDGSAPGVNAAPLEWSETRNIAWKTAIPHSGWSSPAILGEQIWLTTATEDGTDYYAIQVNATTGEIAFNERLFHSDDPEPLGNNVNSYASPSPVIEPGRVYVHFGSYGTACIDTESGKVLWERDDLECRHYRGPGSSPILYENLLILTFDGVDVQYVAALNKDTGETVWRTDRSTEWKDLDENGQPQREGDFRKAYTTPLIVERPDGPLMISPASFAVYAYDPRNGEEIWKIPNESYTAQVRPIYENGIAYVITGYSPTELMAIRVDGKGDIAGTNIEWRVEDDRIIPQTPSPLLVDGRIFLCHNKGTAACIDSATGAEIWRERIGGNYIASPIHAAGRIFFFSSQGETTVMTAGPEPEVLAENRLDEGCLATPAMLGSSLILRTKTHLYRIEAESADTP